MLAFEFQECYMDSKTYLTDLSNKEEERHRHILNLIASENYPSSYVQSMLSSPFAYKYAEGYPGARFYGGCEVVDELEDYTRGLACKVFRMPHANVQPHSGAQANMAVYQALLKPGDTVLALSLDDGGHLTHGSRANESGKVYNFVPYPVHRTENGFEIDLDEVEQLAEKEKPVLIVVGGSSCVAPTDYKAFRRIADKVGAYLMADVAHTAGPIAAGTMESPADFADVMTMTTQKTLRGPRGGLILSTEELAKRIDSAVFPGTQGGPHMHTIASKAAALEEASTKDFEEYQRQVQSAAEGFASFMQNLDGGRDSVMYNARAMPHMVLINTMDMYGLTGRESQQLLEDAGIIVNKQVLPGDTQKPSVGSGIRVGFPAAVTRHMQGNPEPFPYEAVGRAIDTILRTGGKSGRTEELSEYMASLPWPLA